MMTAMDDPQFTEDLTRPAEGEPRQTEETSTETRLNPISNWLETLARLGLGGILQRLGTNVLSLLLILAVVWLLQTFYRQSAFSLTAQPVQAAPLPAATPVLAIASIPEPVAETSAGIPRLALLRTTIPTRPRQEVVKYVVQSGDTIFGIAEKFGLRPQTILWGNYYTLKDDPHRLQPDQELNILPVDGTYHPWQAGEGLNGVAEFYGVDPVEIINYPGNHLDPETIGDFAHPNIEPGTWLIIPGGKREFISWSAPIGVTRDNPAIARIVGPGTCGAIQGGAVGYGYFIWPTVHHFLSGYDYSPETNHRGIDLDGETGDPVFAVDAGVIVYAGWNDHGYGNIIIVDHGNGWQSLYAHLSVINVGCGQSVGQGEVIAAMGSTGNSSGSHLHFELMHTQYGKVNPWDFLPPP